MSLYVFAAPESFWARLDVATAVDQAENAARRISKGVELHRERRRLDAALDVIDRAVREICSDPVRAEGEAAEELLKLLPQVDAVQLPFRAGAASEDGIGGFVVASIPFAPEAPYAEPEAAMPDRHDPAIGAALEGVGSAPARSRDLLIQRIEEARHHGRPVPLGSVRHIQITQALRAYLHRDDRAPFSLTLIHKDGSVSDPIALARLPLRERPTPEVEIALGLNSCRHFELDLEVDFYLLRNMEFDRQSQTSFLDQERAAYDRGRELLACYAGNPLKIALHHTGLEPAVIGFYRAAIDVLLEGEKLIVTPKFFPGAEEAESWW